MNLRQFKLTHDFIVSLKVGYLSEAQVGGYPFDTVIQVVSRVSTLSLISHFCLE